MAKASTQRKEASAPADTTSDNVALSYGDWNTTAQALGWPAGTPVSKQISYLLLNGFKQSMTDAAAITKEQKDKLLATARGSNPDVTMEQVVEAHAHDARTKRFADIMAGNVSSGGGGPKLPAIDRVMRDIAEEQIKAAVVLKGVPMPKGDVLKTLIEKRLSVAGDKIRTEAQARIDAAKNAASDLGDILS